MSEDTDETRKGLGLFLFAHLRLAADADEELASYGLHRTHHRILYLVARGPGTTVGEIVRLLRLTPQGVQGPMRRLIRDGWIEQRSPEWDRRQRQLYVTEEGAKLHCKIAAKQYARLRKAYDRVGPTEAQGFFNIMSALLDHADREYLGLEGPKSFESR